MDQFTEDELTVMIECISRRLYNLEGAGLTDSKCYPLLYSARSKLKKLKAGGN